MRRSSRSNVPISSPVPEQTWLDRETRHNPQLVVDGMSFDMVNTQRAPRAVDASNALGIHTRSQSTDRGGPTHHTGWPPAQRTQRSQSTSGESRVYTRVVLKPATRPQLLTQQSYTGSPPLDVPPRSASAPPESPVTRPDPQRPYDAVRTHSDATQLPLPGTMASRSPDLSRTHSRMERRSRVRDREQQAEAVRRPHASTQGGSSTVERSQGSRFGKKAKSFFRDMFHRTSVDDGHVKKIQVRHWADDDDDEEDADERRFG